MDLLYDSPYLHPTKVNIQETDKNSMIKHLLMSAVLLFPTLVSADSCFPLYEKEAEGLRGEKHVGGQFYVQNGQLGYFQGFKVTDNQFNWAANLVDGIKWGPYLTFGGGHSEDPRKDWLEVFRKSVKHECDLPQGEYTELRSMLKTLMEDGSFCPGNQIIKPSGWFETKGAFKKVFVNAVKDQRFPEYCHSKAVKDDSDRDMKEVSPGEKKSQKKSSASKQ